MSSTYSRCTRSITSASWADSAAPRALGGGATFVTGAAGAGSGSRCARTLPPSATSNPITMPATSSFMGRNANSINDLAARVPRCFIDQELAGHGGGQHRQHIEHLGHGHGPRDGESLPVIDAQGADPRADFLGLDVFRHGGDVHGPRQ